MSWSTVVLAVVPGLIWLWVFWRKDDHEPEPAGHLFAAFLLGGASVGVVWLVRPAVTALLPELSGWTAAIVDAFAVTAAVEETAKLLVLVLFVWWWREFDEPLDGVVYAIAVGLGFASVENVIHGSAWGSDSAVLQRGVTATLGHVAFSGSLGYFLGLARFTREFRRLGWVAAGWGSAVVLHGFYDVLLIGPGRYGPLALVGVLPLALALLGVKIRHLRRRSPEHHPGPETPDPVETSAPGSL